MATRQRALSTPYAAEDLFYMLTCISKLGAYRVAEDIDERLWCLHSQLIDYEHHLSVKRGEDNTHP